MAIQYESDIYFAKTHQDAIIPTKRFEDCGYDLYVVDVHELLILPQQYTNLRTGLISAFSPKYRIKIESRGSTAKAGLMINAGVIDSGYRGEWFVNIVNVGNVPVILTSRVQEITIQDNRILYPTSKAIAQFKVDEVPLMCVEEVDLFFIKNIKSERGDGKEGSSNK